MVCLWTKKRLVEFQKVNRVSVNITICVYFAGITLVGDVFTFWQDDLFWVRFEYILEAKRWPSLYA